MTAKEDEEAIARAQEIGDLIEDALHKTMVSAFTPKATGPRRMSRNAWRAVVDKIIEFAMEED